MKVMYIAPRFHTNQSAVVKGWIERGDEVTFISYYTAIIEDYSYIKPIVLGFSKWYYPIDWLYVNVIKRHDPGNTAFKINHGFPPIMKIRKVMKTEKPDLVILRDRTLYTIVANLFCRRYGYPAILYNQSPLWDRPPKQDFLHKLVRKMTPEKRMTPVIGNKSEEKQIEKGSFFVPFVVEAQVAPKEKVYFHNNKIEILSIGKFEPRKHHIMLAGIIGELSEKIPDIHLTIIGEATGRLQKEHLQEVETYIKDNHLEDYVDIKINVPRKETDNYFRRTDVFVIPSTREMASISQLEAMSFSIPVIISDKNGAACYVEDGQNGYLFKDCDREDLKKKVMMMLSDREGIKKMGEESYHLICEKYTFQNYYQAVMDMLHN